MIIGFDESHKDPKNFSIDDEDNNGFSKLADLLERKGHKLRQFNEPLKDLEVDIAVVAFPKEKIFTDEVDFLVRFVQSGGGLLMMAEWGGIFDNAKNLNKLARKFGLTFNEDRVCDADNIQPTKAGRKRAHNIRITGLNRNYPIVNQVQYFVMTSGCSINPSYKNQIVAWGGPRSWKDVDGDSEYDVGEQYGYIPVMVAAQYGSGRVVALGDGSVLANELFSDPNHQQLALNIFSWLGSEI